MKTKVLIIAVVKKGESILMRKKPDGSPPYKETWYLFGAELSSGGSPDEVIKQTLRKQAGTEIRTTKRFSWDTEVKADLDGITKQFVYLDVECEYVSGDLSPGEGIEKLEWVSITNLSDYDLVPPSIQVFKKLGYFQK